LHAGKLRDSEDIFQEFSLKKYTEFMNIVTWFHVQDPLANLFIKFFNKYSKHDDQLLLLTSQSEWAFIENLKLSNFN
jgi:hypothetical protein